MKMHIAAEGWYKIEALKQDGSSRVLADWFPNLITDAGLNAVATTDPFRQLTKFCKVGSGSTAPSVTDTALVSHVAGAQASSGDFLVDATGYVTVSPTLYYTYDTETYLFALGAVVGNISEIGVGTQAAAGGVLFSRALIKDAGGSPTTLTLAADEQLRVTYELRWYVSTVDVVTTQTLAGVERTVTVRPISVATNTFVQNFPGQGRAYDYGWETGRNFTGWGSGLSSAFSTSIAGYVHMSSFANGASSYGALEAAYVPGNFWVDVRLVINTATANGTIGAFQLGTSGLGTWQIGFSPGIVKNNAQRLEMVVRYSWGRYTP